MTSVFKFRKTSQFVEIFKIHFKKLFYNITSKKLKSLPIRTTLATVENNYFSTVDYIEATAE